MIHVDVDYCLSVVFAVVFLACGVLGAGHEAMVAARAEPNKDHEIAPWVILALVVMGSGLVAIAAYRSGSMYHPCVVKSFETMEKICK